MLKPITVIGLLKSKEKRGFRLSKKDETASLFNGKNI